MIWTDPFLKPIAIPDNLEKQWFSLGDAKFQLLPSQYGFMSAHEEFVGYVGGYGSGKTRIGAIKSAYLAVHPNNRGIIGMATAKDLRDVAQRDTLAFLHEAGLLKKEPTTQNNTAIVRCIDPETGESLGYDSEIQFIHLDDPTHLRGRHIGWFWIDEGSKCKKEAFQNLIGRLRLPAFRNRYKGIVTGNPEGHNWIYDFFFNKELIEQAHCKKPGCKYTVAECNRRTRLKRRAFHCTSYENYFLPPEYIDNMLGSFSEDERKRHIEASFEVFEGQIFKEFADDLHVLFPTRAA